MKEERSEGLPRKYRMERNWENVSLSKIHVVSLMQILSGAILDAPTKTIPHFNFEVPTELPGVDPAILDPRDTYADASEWETKAKESCCKIR